MILADERKVHRRASMKMIESDPRPFSGTRVSTCVGGGHPAVERYVVLNRCASETPFTTIPEPETATIALLRMKHRSETPNRNIGAVAVRPRPLHSQSDHANTTRSHRPTPPAEQTPATPPRIGKCLTQSQPARPTREVIRAMYEARLRCPSLAIGRRSPRTN